MILKSWMYQVYSILVHGPDVMSPDLKPFATLFKYGILHPEDRWTESEKEIVAWSINQALAYPNQAEDPIMIDILPSLPRSVR